MLCLEETGDSNAKQANVSATLQQEQDGVVALDVVTASLWRFGCLIPQQDAEDSGPRHAVARKPTALQLEIVQTVAGGSREGQGASGSLLQHLPIAYCAFRAGGGRRASAGP